MYLFKSKKDRARGTTTGTNSERTCGAFIDVDPDSGWIRKIYICGCDDQTVEVVRGALARVIRPSCFGWIRRLVRRK